MTDIGNLIELDNMAKIEAKRYHKKRFVYGSVEINKGRHFTGIVGARGIGKTVILKQIALENESSFYISLDTFEGDLFEIVNRLNLFMTYHDGFFYLPFILFRLENICILISM